MDISESETQATLDTRHRMETKKINKHNKEKEEQHGTPQKNNI
jgi:hypothetical protein